MRFDYMLVLPDRKKQRPFASQLDYQYKRVAPLKLLYAVFLIPNPEVHAGNLNSFRSSGVNHANRTTVKDITLESCQGNYSEVWSNLTSKTEGSLSRVHLIAPRNRIQIN